MGAIKLPKREDGRGLARRIIDQVKQADSSRAIYLDGVQAGRELLKPRAKREHPPWPGACELQVPLCKSVRNQLVARVHRALLTPEPVYHVSAETNDERDQASAVEAFLQLQVERQVRIHEFASRWFADAFDAGVGVAYLTWRTETRRKLSWEPVESLTDGTAIDATGQPVVAARMELVEQDAVTYDGPDLQLVDIAEFGTVPASNADVQRSTGVYLRFPLTGDELRQGVESGDYDSAAVDGLSAWNGDTKLLSTPDEEARDVRAQADPSTPFSERSFDILECYWRYAAEENGPATDWLLTIHEPSSTLLRAIPNPWAHGQRPVVLARPFGDKYGILGDSVPDLVGDHQDAMTSMLRLAIDSGARQVFPNAVVRDGSLLDEEEDDIRRNMGPGGVTRLRNPDDIRWNSIGFSAASLLPLYAEIKASAERTSGVSDTTTGMAGPRKMTATEVEELLAEGQEFFALIIERLAGAMEDLARMMLSLDYQYVGNESIQRLWATVNPPDAESMGGTPGLEELGGVYHVAAVGVSESTNKALRKQQAQELYGALINDPIVAQDPRLAYRLRENLITNGFGADPVRYLGTEEDYVGRVEQQQAAAQVPGIGGMDDGKGLQPAPGGDFGLAGPAG